MMNKPTETSYSYAVRAKELSFMSSYQHLFHSVEQDPLEISASASLDNQHIADWTVPRLKLKTITKI